MNSTGRMGVGHMSTGRDDELNAAVWNFLRAFMKASKGRPPTAREIRDGTGLRSMKHVQITLNTLEKDGRIRRVGFGRARGISIVGARYLLPDEAEERLM